MLLLNEIFQISFSSIGSSAESHNSDGKNRPSGGPRGGEMGMGEMPSVGSYRGAEGVTSVAYVMGGRPEARYSQKASFLSLPCS